MISTTTHLRHNILFENLDESEFQKVKGHLTEKHFEKGSVIIQGEKIGEELYLLVEGRVKISRTTKSGEELLLALLHQGDFFGDLELVDGRPRSSQIVAVDNCTIFTLPKKDFERLLNESHPFAIRLLQALSIRLRAMNHTHVAELERFEDIANKEVLKLERLIDAAQTLNSTLELDELLDVILETALNIVDGDRGTVYLIEESTHELWSKILTGPEQQVIKLPIGKGIAGYVAATGDTLNIPDAYLDSRFNPEFDKESGYHTKTILCMPMKNKSGKIIGVFQLLNKRAGAFTVEDEQIIEAMSVHAVIGVENARLYNQERQKIAMEKEIIAAAEVQISLLPQTVPAINGYDFAAKSIPARNIAGDLFDFIPIDDHTIAVILGDVTGKGLPASLLMANLQATLRSTSLPGVSCKECLEKTNRLLFKSTGPDKFATLFYGILDCSNHSLSFTNAGQEYPFVISEDKSIRRLKTGGIPLGLLGNATYEEEKISLSPGDMMVIVSDGITEAMNVNRKLFSDERLSDIIKENFHLTAAELIEKIIAEIRLYSKNSSEGDDITIVAFKRNR